METVVIVIPTYNEALVIQETLHHVFQAVMPLSDYQTHILVFDSASEDDTQRCVEALMPMYPGRLHLKTEPYKTGLGSAYQQAMAYALHKMQADIVVEFDADLSHQPNYLPLLLNALKTYDVAMGSRYVPGGGIPKNWGLHRKALSVLGNYVARRLLKLHYRDFTTGFRATHRRVLLKVLPDEFLSNHYAYKLHLLWLLHHANAEMIEIPIQFIDREKGQSKLPANSIRDTLRVLMLLRRQAYS